MSETFRILQEIYDNIDKVVEERDNTFYGHDGNLLYNTENNMCYSEAENCEKLDTAIDKLRDKYEQLKSL